MLHCQGDYVEDFQPLCEVQSDKATIEITSRYKGKISNILYVPGDIVKVSYQTSFCCIFFNKTMLMILEFVRVHW